MSVERLFSAAMGAVLLTLSGCSCDPGSGPDRRDAGGTTADSSTDRLDGRIVERRDANTRQPDAACERVNVDAVPDAANVLIVLDASGSMYETNVFGDVLVDRWTPSVGAIDAMTASLQDQLNFGLMVFPPRRESCGTGQVEVPIGPRNANTIATELAGPPATKTGGGTPIASTLAAARRALASLPGDTVVLLVTDGAPNCNDELDSLSCVCTTDICSNNSLCLDDLEAVSAAEELAAAGIPTYVVGYDIEDARWQAVMNRMAVGGGTTRYYPVEDRATLEAALAEIGGSVVSCSYELASVPDDVRYVRVRVDGTQVDHESAAGPGQGWRLNGRTIELQGSACSMLRDGREHDVDIVVECTPVLI